MKTIIRNILTGAALFVALLFIPAAQAGYWGEGPLPIAGVAGYTNQLFGVNTNGIWPSCILPGQSVTNVTPIAVNGTQVSFQFDAQVTVTAAASPTNIIAHIGRSVRLPQNMPSRGISNAIATGATIDWFATITNQLPSSAVANTTYTAPIATFGPQTGFTTGAAEGGCTTFYLGWIDAPANLTVTNWQITVNPQ